MDIIKSVKKRFTIIFLLFFLVCGLACTKRSENSDKNNSNVRIVSTYSAYTEILISIGAKSTIVGATKNDADILNVTSIGTHLSPSLEAIISCKPDVVLLSRHREEHTLRLTESLEKIGIKVISLKPSTIDEVISVIDTLGKVSNCHENASQIIMSIKKDVEFVFKRVELIPDSLKMRVFLEVRSEPNLLTCGKNSIAYDIIKRAGGIPVFDQPKKILPVSMEKLYDLNIDFYFQQKGIMNKNPVNPGNIKQLKRLKSIKNEDYAILEEALISRPGPRVGEAVKLIFEYLYKRD